MIKTSVPNSNTISSSEKNFLDHPWVSSSGIWTGSYLMPTKQWHHDFPTAFFGGKTVVHVYAPVSRGVWWALLLAVALGCTSGVSVLHSTHLLKSLHSATYGERACDGASVLLPQFLTNTLHRLWEPGQAAGCRAEQNTLGIPQSSP